MSPVTRLKRGSGGFGAILLLVLMADPLWGQLPPPSPGGPRIHMAVDTARVTVGDRIRLRVAVDHPPDSRVIWPDSLNLAPFQVLEAEVGPTQRGDGVVRSTLTLTLAAFELGDLEIPSFQVEVADPQGDSETLETNRYGVRVESVGLDEGGDIREIKGPLRLPGGLGGILLLGAVAGLVALLAWALHRRRKGKEGGRAESPPEAPTRPPHELALEALARLEASTLLERGEVKDYYIQVSEILRVYVEGRFRVPALEMTTWDVTSGLRRVGLEDPLLGDLRRFLERCDLVKFAKHRPSEEESRAVLADGRRFVEETIPVPPDPAPKEGPLPVGVGLGGESSRGEAG